MKSTGLLLFLCFAALSAFTQQNYWQQQVDYDIQVSLDDTKHSLTGYETIRYQNNSPDTLRFIWFHLWANAYKNDRTAFSDQQLENGSTQFYFSNNDERGYINRLAFKVNGSIATVEDHPQHQDIIKVNLPQPLAPHQSCEITTPFHVKLPYNFSRGGHIAQSYQVTQWYPKAAVYDKSGWHEMPYLDQGEFYSDFGNYAVAITLPDNYIVAATGELINTTQTNNAVTPVLPSMEATLKTHKQGARKKQINAAAVPSSSTQKKIIYQANNVIDFAWFADKNFAESKDTLLLPSGRIIKVAAYYLPTTQEGKHWQQAVWYIKKTILNRSKLIGEYPYNTATAVQGAMPYSTGMEYPSVTVISGTGSAAALEGTIEHEIGHNWLYGILATNERLHPWMDEGMNSYYGNRYTYEPATGNTSSKKKSSFIASRMPADYGSFFLRYSANEKKDQPIETASENFSAQNYGMIAYYKASVWMEQLEKKLGTALFDSCMRAYFKEWQFKHPTPEDFKTVLEKTAGRSMSDEFAVLQESKKQSALVSRSASRPVKLASLFSFRETDKYRYIFVSPAAGYNQYDKFMLGAFIHNYTLPAEKLQFLAAPVYSFSSKKLNGVFKLNYHFFSDNSSSAKFELGMNGAKFSINHSLDTTGANVYSTVSKLVPYISYRFSENERSTRERSIDLRTFFINEQLLNNYDTIYGSNSSTLYPKTIEKGNRYINQLTYTVTDSRVLYPYSYSLQLQQGSSFYRINAEGNYFFNYAKGGGMSVRFFAAKFGYIGDRNGDAYLYQPKLLGGNGSDDYTYSNYFVGRTASAANSPDLAIANEGFAARQIMIANTGGLKFRLDPFSIQGQSDNWIAALNFSSTLPEKLFPVKIPLKVFVDIGTYAEPWQKGSSLNKYLYTGGLQLSLLKNAVNIYVPLIYSKDFRDFLKTDANNNTFFKKITFSIDIRQLTLKKIFPQFAL